MDKILKSLRLLKESQEEGQTTIKRRLDQLEIDVAVGQEDATQRVVKQLREDQTFTFKKKGNKKQFIFNDNVKDRFITTAKHLGLVNLPSGSGQREAIDKASGGNQGDNWRKQQSHPAEPFRRFPTLSTPFSSQAPPQA